MVLEENEIKKFEIVLKARKEKLENDLGRIAKPTSEGGDYETKYNDIGEDVDENATEVEEYVGNIGVENTLEEQLKAVNDALEKIKDGTFGVCEVCGKDIASGRLEANPAARRCMECAGKN